MFAVMTVCQCRRACQLERGRRYLLCRGDGQPHVLWIWDLVAAKLAAVLLLCR